MKAWKLVCAGFLVAALSACKLLPDQDGRHATSRTPPPIERGGVAVPSVAGRQCLARLGAAGASFSPLPDAVDAPGCTRTDTVSLTDLKGDASRFGIRNLGPVTCETADTFAGWVRYGVDRAARQILGSPLSRIETMGSYACRNVAGSAKRSAHARAEAIDVAAFVLEDGRRITLKGDWNSGSTAERRFLRVVRSSACKRFGTVLSPDYNAAHADHFHMEVGDGTFCR